MNTPVCQVAQCEFCGKWWHRAWRVTLVGASADTGNSPPNGVFVVWLRPAWFVRFWRWLAQTRITIRVEASHGG